MRGCELKTSHYDRVESCIVPMLDLVSAQPFSRDEPGMEISKTKAQISKLVKLFFLRKKEKKKAKLTLNDARLSYNARSGFNTCLIYNIFVY